MLKKFSACLTKCEGSKIPAVAKKLVRKKSGRGVTHIDVGGASGPCAFCARNYENERERAASK